MDLLDAFYIHCDIGFIMNVGFAHHTTSYDQCQKLNRIYELFTWQKLSRRLLFSVYVLDEEIPTGGPPNLFLRPERPLNKEIATTKWVFSEIMHNFGKRGQKYFSSLHSEIHLAQLHVKWRLLDIHLSWMSTFDAIHRFLVWI